MPHESAHKDTQKNGEREEGRSPECTDQEDLEDFLPQKEGC